LSFASITTGCVVKYPYLWAREHQNKQTEGAKFRPVAVGVRIPAKNPGTGDRVLLFPITSLPPPADRLNLEIPVVEKRRAGLDDDKRLWIVLDEYNLDVIGQSYDLPPTGPIGMFSKGFFETVLVLVLADLATAIAVNRRA
jgi:hypothetical protein